MDKRRFSVISLFPEMFDSLIDFGVSSKAYHNNIIDISFFNPRDYANDRHKTVDDRPYGGGPGMLMMYEPLAKAVEDAKLNHLDSSGSSPKVIYLSPQGKTFNQCMAKKLSKEDSIILVCGRYEGVDERFIQDYVDEEVSIGDFIVSGGEFPAMLVMDSILRMVPGVLGCEDSAREDSFYSGLLDCGHYTRPAILENSSNVPSVLLSGNHSNIKRWRMQQMIGRTIERRPDLLTRQCLSEEQEKLYNNYLNEKDKYAD